MEVMALLASTGGTDAVAFTAGSRSSRPVRTVRLCDTPEAVAAAGEGGFAIVTPSASAELAGYRLDVTVRLACDAGLAAVALYGVDRVPATADRLAVRGSLVLVALDPRADAGDLLIQLDHGLRPDASSALARLSELERALSVVVAEPTSAILAIASRAIGAPLQVEDGDVVASPDIVGGAVAARITADAIDRARRSRDAEADHRIRSGSRMLGDLLSSARPRGPGAVERVQRLGLPIEAAHRVALIRAGADHLSPTAHDRAETVARIAAAAGGDQRGWLVGVRNDRVVMIRSGIDEDSSAIELRRVVEAVLERASGNYPDIVLAAGMGTSQTGWEGLRTSHVEAEAALSSRAAGNGSVALFDASGLLRLIAQWAPTASGERTLGIALEPLLALGPARGRVMVHTLQVYLDALGSNTAAARVLHLHPNAVAYRLRRIRELLGSDLSAPDERIMLQIACRAVLSGPFREAE